MRCGQNGAMESKFGARSALAIQPEDIARIAWIGDIELSPDGTRVAYVVSTPSLERDETTSAIWVSAAEPAAVPYQFTAGTLRDTYPRWSPDGRKLAFLSERPCPDIIGPGSGRPQLYVMPASGGEARRLTSASGGVTQLTWAPDGSSIAIVARVPMTPQEPQKTTFAGDRPPSSPFRVIEALKYRRNGEGFVDSRRHVFVVEVHGSGRVVQLTAGDYDHADPAWAPDGIELAFVSARHDSRDRDNAQAVMALRVPRSAGPPDYEASVRTITTAGGPASHPAWSPDGRWIAFAGHAYPTDTGRHLRVWVAPATGGPAQLVVDPLDRNVAVNSGSRPNWADNGEAIMFTVEDDGATTLVAADHPGAEQAGGRARIRVVAGGNREISAFSAPFTANCIAVVSSDPSRPAEVITIRSIDGEWIEVPSARMNCDWLADAAAGSIHRLVADGPNGAISVWVQLPPGTDEAQRNGVPVLVSIHGGPHAQYGDRFFDEFAVYAGAGYAVVFTNPHGSTGRSEPFARAVRRDWGGIDADDVLAAVDSALAALPCLDPSRMGIIGGSYGGYLTSWIVAHDHRFRAACSERAVKDFQSFAGTSDIGFWFAEGQLGASPFEDPALAARHSPLTFAGDIRTPLLIMHSELDYRCPIEQAERMFVALAARNHPVRFIRIPDADHELSRSGRPRQRVERFRHILEWFGEHLGPSSGGDRGRS